MKPLLEEKEQQNKPTSLGAEGVMLIGLTLSYIGKTLDLTSITT